MLPSAEMCSSSFWNSSSHPRISLQRCLNDTRSSAYEPQNSRICFRNSSIASSPCATVRISLIFASFARNAGVQKSRTRKNSKAQWMSSALSTALQ